MNIYQCHIAEIVEHPSFYIKKQTNSLLFRGTKGHCQGQTGGRTIYCQLWHFHLQLQLQDCLPTHASPFPSIHGEDNVEIHIGLAETKAAARGKAGDESLNLGTCGSQQENGLGTHFPLWEAHSQMEE